MTGPDLDSNANAYTISNPPAPPVPTVFWVFFFPLHLGLSRIATPRFYPSTPLIHLFTLSSFPLSIARSHSNRLTGRLPCLPAATTRLRLPPMRGGPKEFLAREMPAFPFPVSPPAVLNKFPGPCCPQGYPAQVSFSPSACPHQPHTRPHPLLASTGGPVPCRPQVVTPCYYSLVPCASALPSLIYFAPSLDIF